MFQGLLQDARLGCVTRLFLLFLLFLSIEYAKPCRHLLKKVFPFRTVFHQFIRSRNSLTAYLSALLLTTSVRIVRRILQL